LKFGVHHLLYMFAKSIALHTGIQVGGRAVSVVFGILTLGILTRYLGTEYFGWYTTATTYMQIFAIVVDLGITLTLLQLIAEFPEKSEVVVGTIFTLRVASAAIVLGIAPIAAFFLPYPRALLIGIVIVSISFFFGTLHQMLTGIFQKHLKMQQLMGAEVAGRIALYVAAIVIAWRMPDTVVGYWLLLGAMGIANLCMFALSFSYARKLVPIHFVFDLPVALLVVHRAWPIALTTLANLLYLKMDTVFLSFYRSQAEVGMYGAPYRIMEVLVYAPTAFMGLLLPVLTASWVRGDREAFLNIARKGFDMLLLVTLAMGVGMYVTARPLMRLVAGASFTASGAVLEILTFAVCAIFISTFWSHVIIALNRQKKVIPVFLASAVFALIGYKVFIPRYGMWGAAWMTVAVEVAVMIGTYAVVWRESELRPDARGIVRAFAVAAGMAAVLLPLRGEPLVVLFATGMVSFFAFALVVRALPTERLRRMLCNRAATR